VKRKEFEMEKFKVYIKDFKFKAIIGILEKERVSPQDVEIDMEIEYVDRTKFVDYVKVCELVEDLVKTNRYGLIEDALSEAVEEIKREFENITQIKMLIKKPTILNNALVGVEILRKF
jgi:dihydroneopterin aldolase